MADGWSVGAGANDTNTADDLKFWSLVAGIFQNPRDDHRHSHRSRSAVNQESTLTKKTPELIGRADTRQASDRGVIHAGRCEGTYKRSKNE